MTQANHGKPVVRMPVDWMRHWYFRYGVAVLAVAAATLMHYALAAHLGLEPHYILFYPTVMLVALVGGFWPGILAIVLSAASVDYFFLQPQYSFHVSRRADIVMLLLYVPLAVAISAFAEMLRRRNQNLHTYSRRFELATHAAAMGIWDWTINTNEITWDKRTFEIFGVPIAEKITYERWKQTVHPDDLSRIESTAWEAIRRNQIASFQFRIVRASDGALRHIMAAMTPVTNHAGEINRCVGVNFDVTERKQSEDRLREYEKALEGLEEMVCVVDREYRYVLANRAFLNHRGVAREQLVGHLVPEVLNKDVFETFVKEKFDESFQGKAVSYELRDNYPHLGNRDLYISYFPIEGPLGIDRLVCVLQDITERKRAECATEEWQKRLELAERAGLRIGLWDWDVSANAVAWSDESYRQWGFTRDTFSGNVEEAVVRIHPEDRPRVEEAIRRVLAGGTEYTAQYRVVRPDRTTCWIDAYGVVVRERETRMLGIGIDITNLKKTEQSLQEAKMEMARVARIAIVGELTASIAHEINQPLAAVVANGSASLRWLAIQPPNLEEARDAMTQAIAEANRTSDVIARIRSLLQKAPPQMGRIDVDQLIRAVLALSDNELLKGEVTVETELAADVPAVLGDRVQLQQVMLNLIMNAIDAMSTINHVPRRLLIKSVPHPDGVLIQVQDSGTGLDPEQLDRIFDPFFTTKPEGIGMGLSIARSMVEAHGGRLWATPASPRGAAFQFTLPAAPNE